MHQGAQPLVGLGREGSVAPVAFGAPSGNVEGVFGGLALPAVLESARLISPGSIAEGLSEVPRVSCGQHS